MAYSVETPEFSTLTAAADYSSNQYQGVAITAAASTVTLASVQGQKVDGVLTNDPTSGAVAIVQTYGIAKWKAGGTVAIGDDLIVDSTGRVIAAGNNTGYLIGKALEAGATNEIISIVIQHRGDRPVSILSFPAHNLATIADGDVLTNFTPGFRGRIIGFAAAVTNEVTTGSKGTTLNMEIGTTNLTGGSLVLTSANLATLGAVVASTAITAANSFTATDTISIEAASTTAFAEGGAVLYVTLMQD